MDHELRKYLRLLLATAGLLIGVWLLIHVVHTTDFSRSASLLGEFGPLAVLLILAPYSIAALLDTEAWRRLMPNNVGRTSYIRLFHIRAATEAIALSLPLGSVASDPLKSVLMKRELGMGYANSSASVVLRKFLLGLTQCAIAVIVALLSYGWVRGALGDALHLPAMAFTLIAIAAVGLLIYGSLTMLACYGSVVRKVHAFMSKTRIGVLRKWFVKQEPHFLSLNEELRTLGSERGHHLREAALLYIGLWFFESLETYVILHALGSSIAVPHAIAIEILASFIRSLAFMIPSGIGVQDASYLAFLSASGEAQAIAAAFLIVKRSRELLWIVLGYGLLALSGFSVRNWLQPATES